ncbi:MAG: protein translocase subunit SecD [Anaeromicrobium sp.]|jgi:protein-export SecD/SecF family membrane protein|uniref:protein translocase subunit SecD n=1 Tax=Anaeromicrobium sp. TaxID=1929132 RepID=UPI0025CF9869|nr:protein translocase subunit SecD [Anaeromicrobium sp.]MCT4595017.1 protein translocase subunit SecD [Anaeromicrobium sp.]
MNLKNAVILILLICLTVTGAVAGFKGLEAGNVKIKPVKDMIELGLDLKGGVYVVLEAQTDAKGNELDKIMNQTKEVLERRIDAMGLTQPNVNREGDRRIRVELPGVSDSNEAIKAIGKTAQLQFVDKEGKVILTGNDVKNAELMFLTDKGNVPVVSLEFKSDGADKFREATKEASINRDPILIVLDNAVISAPRVNSEIPNGKATIEGNFTREGAANLAALIRGGALPVELKEVQSSVIGPTLGLDSLNQSVKAALFGIIGVFLFMLIVYRLPGLIANLALVIYILIVLWSLIGFNAVLTLPGIAGLILSIGMAVDANVIIFERIKEEIRNGKSIRASISSGFSRAFKTILDSNVTTLIAGVVLYQFGSGPIKGFAVTLMIGIFASMITALGVTRLVLNIVANAKGLKNPKFYGA